jgi:hypothetical protein
MSDGTEQQYTSPPTIVSRSVGGETVLVDLDSERYYSVNQTGSLIWAELSAGRSTAQALERIMTEFNIGSDVARQDLDELVAALVAAGLLEPQA